MKANSADPELQLGQIGQLDVGDDDAEQEDLHHRPGVHDLGRPKHPGEAPGPTPEAQGQQDVGGRQQLGERYQDRGAEHECRERPHAVLVELDHAGRQRAGGGPALELEGQEREAVGDHEQDQRGQRQHQGAIDAVDLASIEHRAAPRAARGAPFGQWPQMVHEAAVVAGHDFRPGGWLYWPVHVSPEAVVSLEYSLIMALRKSPQLEELSVGTHAYYRIATLFEQAALRSLFARAMTRREKVRGRRGRARSRPPGVPVATLLRGVLWSGRGVLGRQRPADHGRAREGAGQGSRLSASSMSLRAAAGAR